MTRTSITSTALALPIKKEQKDIMSNQNTVFEDKIQSVLTAPLRFIIPQREKPVFRSAAIAGGQEEFFFETEEQMVPITDLRSIAEQMTLDREGFALLIHWLTQKPQPTSGLSPDHVVVKKSAMGHADDVTDAHIVFEAIALDDLGQSLLWQSQFVVCAQLRGHMPLSFVSWIITGLIEHIA